MGWFGGPTAAEVRADCAAYLDDEEELLAFVVGRALNDRLLYVVTERAVHVIAAEQFQLCAVHTASFCFRSRRANSARPR